LVGLAIVVKEVLVSSTLLAISEKIIVAIVLLIERIIIIAHIFEKY